MVPIWLKYTEIVTRKLWQQSMKERILPILNVKNCFHLDKKKENKNQIQMEIDVESQ